MKTYQLAEIVDLGAYAPPLDAYRFKAVATDSTLTGFFVNIGGRQTGGLYSLTITSGAVKSFDDARESTNTPPADAVGFVGMLDQDVYYSYGGNPGAGYPKVTASSNCAFGRIG